MLARRLSPCHVAVRNVPAMDRVVLPGLPRRAGVAVGLAASIARVALDPSARRTNPPRAPH